MRFGIIVFPGSNCDHDCHYVVKNVLGHEAEFIWHKEKKFSGFDCIILPGGFSYGDYLRSGAMAACSPVMGAVREYAKNGGLLIGICNGFQILQEAKLLPGVMMRNNTLKFVCKDVHVRVEETDTPFTCACKKGEILKIPVAHMDGNFFMDKRAISELGNSRQILFKYCEENGELSEGANPNGSLFSIAGVMNKQKNVMGLMPHPERRSETLLGNKDGQKIFESIILWQKQNQKSK